MMMFVLAVFMVVMVLAGMFMSMRMPIGVRMLGRMFMTVTVVMVMLVMMSEMNIEFHPFNLGLLLAGGVQVITIEVQLC